MYCVRVRMHLCVCVLCFIHALGHATDNRRIDFVSKSGVHLYVRASTPEDRQQWMLALGEAKQAYNTPLCTRGNG